MADPESTAELSPKARLFLDKHVRIRNTTGQRAAPRIAVGRGAANASSGANAQVEPPAPLVAFNRLQPKYEEMLPKHTSTAAALKFVYNKAKVAVESEDWEAAAEAVKNLDMALRREPPVRPQPVSSAQGESTASQKPYHAEPGEPTAVPSKVDPVKVGQRLIRNHFNLLKLQYEEVLPKHTSTAAALTFVFNQAKAAVEGEQWDVAGEAVKDLEAAIRRPPPQGRPTTLVAPAQAARRQGLARDPVLVQRRFERAELEYRKVLPLHTITAGALTFHYEAARQALERGDWNAASAAITGLEQTVRTPPSRPQKAAPETEAQKAKREQREKEKREYVRACNQITFIKDLLEKAPVDSMLAKVGVAFNKIPMPPDPEKVADHRQALIDIAPKVEQAETVQAARDYPDKLGSLEKKARKAMVYAKQSGAMPGLEDGVERLEAVLDQAKEATEKLDFIGASALLVDARKLADAIALPYDTLVAIENDKPLLVRAERALKQKKLWDDKTLHERRSTSYAELSKAHAAARQTTDHASWKSTAEDLRGMAEAIVKYVETRVSDDWYDDRLAKPASRPQPSDAIGESLTTMPKFSALSEGQKLKVMEGSTGLNSDLLEFNVKKTFLDARVQGIALPLSPAQMAAAIGYSGENYRNINGLLRGSKDEKSFSAAALDQTKVHIVLLKQVLDRLPDYGTAGFPLFRWETPYGDYLQSRYRVGAEFEIREFWSTGASGGSLVDASDPPTAEILVWGKEKSQGKDISALSTMQGEGGRSDGARLKGQGGGEVLFPPGTRFRTEFFKAYDRDNNAVDDKTMKERLRRIDPQHPGLPVDLHYRIEVQEL